MLKNGKELSFMKKIRFSLTRMTAMLLVLVCMLGLLPATALAASPSTIKEIIDWGGGFLKYLLEPIEPQFFLT